MKRASQLSSGPITAWTVGFIVLGLVLIAAAWWPIYATPRVWLVVGVAGLVGLGIAAIATWRAWRWWWTALALTGAYLVLVVPLAIPAALELSARLPLGIRDGVAGIVLGWKQLVTLDLPLGHYQAVLVPLFAVALFSGWGMGALGLSRRRFAPAAVAVLVAAVGIGIAFGASELGASVSLGPVAIPGAALVLIAVATLVLGMTWLVILRRRQRAEALARARAASAEVSQGRGSSAPAIRRTALGAGILIVAVTAGIAIAPLASAGDRTTVREGVEPTLLLSRIDSPLSTYRSWFSGDALSTEIFTVSDVSDDVDRLRLATLTDYDGVRFHVPASETDRFTRVPGGNADGPQVTATVTIGEGYQGPWLPTPGPVTVAPTFAGERRDVLADGFYVGTGGTTAVVVERVDEASEILAALSPGDRYDITGGRLGEVADLESTNGGAALIDDEQFPELVAWVDNQELPRGGAGVVAAAQLLQERGFLSHSRVSDEAASGWIAALTARADYAFEPSLAGHSAARIEDLFSQLTEQELKSGEDPDPEALVSGIGDDEQFAVALALVARYLGVESRVVVGVLLSSENPTAPVLPCVDGVCTGANVTAWVEVLADNGQWVALDASPQFAEPVSRVVVGEVLPELPTVPEEVTGEVIAPPDAIRTDATELDDPPATIDEQIRQTLRTLGWIVGLIGVIVALALPAFLPVIAKAIQRRSRRRAANPEVALVGAWEELVDRYTDAQLITAPAVTRTLTTEAAGRPGARGIATSVDAAVFSPGQADRAFADQVWHAVRIESKNVSRALPFFQRIAAAMSPRSFVRNIRRRAIPPTSEPNTVRSREVENTP